jgi:apolipoprotein D and lipocalin family protein
MINAKMRSRILLPLLGILIAGVSVSPHAETPVASVDRVDLPRYAGQWYEIASFPMFFQRNCIGDTTANYALTQEGEVTVANRCRTDSGFDEAQRTAWAVTSSNAQLKVSFFWPFGSDYWVIGLDADYRWAVVGNPNRKYLWILSRSPQLPRNLLDAALQAATAQGYDLTQLRYTKHGAVKNNLD